MVKKASKFLNITEKKGVQAFINNVRNMLGDNILTMLIFGSKITGNFDAESDIDILIMLNHRTWEIQNEIAGLATEINLQFGINISPLIITKSEYEKNKYYETEFAKEIGLTGIQI